MYLSKRIGFFFFFFNVPSVSSKHGIPSVPYIIGALSDVFFFFSLLNIKLYLEYMFLLEYSDPVHSPVSFNMEASRVVMLGGTIFY